jgi:hypothetical protein
MVSVDQRPPSAGVYRWEIDKGRRSLAVAVNGPIVADDADVPIRAAMEGAGRLPGYFLYYPSRRQQRAAVMALIDVLRL